MRLLRYAGVMHMLSSRAGVMDMPFQMQSMLPFSSSVSFALQSTG